MSSEGERFAEMLYGIDDPEVVRDWVFSFGAVHVHPETGESLRQRYVRIRGSFHGARERMFAMFGTKWSHQSSADLIPQLEQCYGDTELPESEWPAPRSPT